MLGFDLFPKDLQHKQLHIYESSEILQMSKRVWSSIRKEKIDD